jgi:hypothetical protein
MMKDFNFRSVLTFAALCLLTATPMTVLAGPIKTADVKQVVSSNPNRLSTLGSTRLVTSYQDPAALVGRGDGDETKKNESRVITEESVEITEEPCNCESEVAAFVVDRGGFPWWSLGFAGAAPLAFISGRDDDALPVVSPSPAVSPSVPPSGTPSPSPSLSPSPSPSPSPSVSPSPTPTGTPTPSPSPTPSVTPTPTPSPSPSPSLTPTPTPTPSPSPTPTATPSPSPLPSPSATPTPTVTPTPRVTPSGTPEPVPEPMTIILFGTGLAGAGYIARRMRRKNRENDEKGGQE